MIRHVLQRLPRPLLASGAALLLLAALLLVLIISRNLGEQLSPTLEVREVALALPPPPPPAAPTPPVAVDIPLTINVSGQGPSLQVPDIIPPLNISAPASVALSVQMSDLSDLAPDTSAFDLSELDDLPTLLTPLNITLPERLRRQGVEVVHLRLEVLIDEQGRVSLEQVLENPYPELNGEIQRLVRASRFSAPKKDKQPVKARFIWPIDIKS